MKRRNKTAELKWIRQIPLISNLLSITGLLGKPHDSLIKKWDNIFTGDSDKGVGGESSRLTYKYSLLLE